MSTWKDNIYGNWHSAGMALFQGPWRLKDPREQRLVLREKAATSQLSPPFPEGGCKARATKCPGTRLALDQLRERKPCSQAGALPLNTLSSQKEVNLSNQKTGGYLYSHNPKPARPCSQNLTCRGNTSIVVFQTCLCEGFPFLPTLLQSET